jgi:hemin uptake protein HemP
VSAVSPDEAPLPAPPLADRAAAPAAAEPAAVREQWTSAELLGDRTEVLIVHGHEVYRLRRTRQDKLILYK